MQITVLNPILRQLPSTSTFQSHHKRAEEELIQYLLSAVVLTSLSPCVMVSIQKQIKL